MPSPDELPEERRVYRCEVEIIELSSGSTRRVPLTFHTVKALLPRSQRRRRARKASGALAYPSEQPSEDLPVPPPNELMRFVDGSLVLEASTWDDLRARLRERYPDDRYGRRLHVHRDGEAEARREGALQGLIKLLAEAVVRDFLKEQTAARSVGNSSHGSSTSP